jgi:hypothetical protein
MGFFAFWIGWTPVAFSHVVEILGSLCEEDPSLGGILRIKMVRVEIRVEESGNRTFYIRLPNSHWLMQESLVAGFEGGLGSRERVIEMRVINWVVDSHDSLRPWRVNDWIYSLKSILWFVIPQVGFRVQSSKVLWSSRSLKASLWKFESRLLCRIKSRLRVPVVTWSCLKLAALRNRSLFRRCHIHSW